MCQSLQGTTPDMNSCGSYGRKPGLNSCIRFQNGIFARPCHSMRTPILMALKVSQLECRLRRRSPSLACLLLQRGRLYTTYSIRKTWVKGDHKMLINTGTLKKKVLLPRDLKLWGSNDIREASMHGMLYMLFHHSLCRALATIISLHNNTSNTPVTWLGPNISKLCA